MTHLLSTLVRMEGPITTDEIRDLLHRAALLPADAYAVEDEDIEYDEVARQSSLVLALCNAYRVFSKGEVWLDTGEAACRQFSKIYVDWLMKAEPDYYKTEQMALEGVEWPAWMQQKGEQVPRWLVSETARAAAALDIKRLHALRELALKEKKP